MSVGGAIVTFVFGRDSKFSQEPLAVVTGLGLVIIWAGWYIVSRWGVQGTMTPADIALVRYVTAAAVTWPLFFFLKGRKMPWKPLCILVPTYGVAYIMPLYYGLQTTPVANAGVLFNGMLPILNGLLVWVMYKQGISRGKWLGIALLTLANACMFFSGLAAATLTWGWAMILFSTLMLSIYMTVYRQHPLDYQVLIPVMAWGNLLLFLPLFPLLESNLAAASLYEILLQGLFQGFLNQILVIGLIAFTVPRLGSVTTSVLYGFVPVLTAILGWLILMEELNWLEVIGIIGCTAGIVVYSRQR